ncbi:hypothetical protein DENSPDRAFT_876473 [Dentipellis sp. KUC8613]|nr:hypothetical protein DENSPDRAFT_876473 [Dentipellis sp. KUC8613]
MSPPPHSTIPPDKAQTSSQQRSPPVVPSHRPSSPHNTPLPHASSPPMASVLTPLLRCIYCNKPLVTPITLLCGHSVCSRHLRRSASSVSIPAGTPTSESDSFVQQPECPVSGCTYHGPTPQSPPNIPSGSQVTYIPVSADPEANADSDEPLPPFSLSQTDVTVNKILTLLSRIPDDNHTPSQSAADLLVDSDEQTDEDDEEFDPSNLPFPHPDDLDSSPATSSRSSATRPRPRTSSEDSSSIHHPRKRRRRQIPPAATNSRDTGAPALDPDARFEKELLTELSCEICFMLLYQPVTTPCQHTFCAKCLQRSLDHSQQCPLCRQVLPGFSYFHEHPYNKTVLSIILKAFPDSYAERGRIIEQEERDSRLDTPIFVCQLSFPGIPTFLHFFEPRYRLMLRRCLESADPCFGMIMPRSAGGITGNEYGTMLKISRVRMYPDGRSVVETHGTHRFRIMERGTLDGYMVGRIERIDDYQEELDEFDDTEESLIEALQVPGTASVPEIPSSTAGSTSRSAALPPVPSNEALMEICRAFVDQLQRGAAPWVVQRLNTAVGPMPTDPSNFSFWMAVVLPIDEVEKAKLLPIKSPRLRLRLVVYWIEQLNSQWWFSSGCIIS